MKEYTIGSDPGGDLFRYPHCHLRGMHSTLLFFIMQLKSGTGYSTELSQLCIFNGT